jgi:hypothetical protein
MDRPVHYVIRVKGHLDESWADWFEGLSISNLEGGEAVIAGSLPDQAALHGVLNQISNLGVELLSVEAVPENDE